MQEEKFVDSINLILSEFQISTSKIINKRTPTYFKLEELGLVLAYFKDNVFRSLIKFKKQLVGLCKLQNNTPSILEQQYESAHKTFQKLNLHHILSRKVHKLNKQSAINLSQSQSNASNFSTTPHIYQAGHNIKDLRNSLCLLQADLGIETHHQDQYVVSQSIRDQISKFLNNSEIHKSIAAQQTINELQTSIKQNKYDIHNQSLDKSISEVVHRSMLSIEGTPIRIPNKQQQILNQSITSNYYNHLLPEEKPQTKSQLRIKEQHSKVKRKKKGIVYSSKDRVLDNLLEQSYMSCLEHHDS